MSSARRRRSPAERISPSRRRRRQLSDTRQSGPVVVLAPKGAAVSAALKQATEGLGERARCLDSVSALVQDEQLLQSVPRALFLPGGNHLAGQVAALQAHPAFRDLPPGVRPRALRAACLGR